MRLGGGSWRIDFLEQMIFCDEQVLLAAISSQNSTLTESSLVGLPRTHFYSQPVYFPSYLSLSWTALPFLITMETQHLLSGSLPLG